MKGVLLTTFLLCFVHTYGFSLNHTCYTIRPKDQTFTPIQTCVTCFKDAYPEGEPEEIEKLNDAALECVKQLPDDLQNCVTRDTDQKHCLELRAFKHFRELRKNFWRHYEQTLSEEERCQVQQYIGIAWYLYTIRRNSLSDWEKINTVVTPCREELHKNIKVGKREANVHDSDPETTLSPKEASVEEDELEDADRLRHNLKLTEKYMQCMLDEVEKDEDARNIYLKAIDSNCHSVPTAVLKKFYELKAKP